LRKHDLFHSDKSKGPAERLFVSEQTTPRLIIR
jgi:hypothetical protein